MFIEKSFIERFLYFFFSLSFSSMENSNGYYSDNADETPEDLLMELIARFGQTLMRARDEVAK